MSDTLTDIGTNALIHELWTRGDLGLAWATFERRRRTVGDACDELADRGVPEDLLRPIRDLILKPTVVEADAVSPFAVPHPGYCHRLPECFGRASCPRDISCID